MSTIIEQVLSLPEEEKIEIYHALQENLNLLDADEQEILSEVEKRQKSIDDGTANFISGDEFLSRLRTLQNELHNKRS